MTTFTSTDEQVKAESNGAYHRANGPNTTEQDANARACILALQAHEKPPTLPDVGKWAQCIHHLITVYDATPDSLSHVISAFIGSGKYPGLKELISDEEPVQGDVLGEEYSVPKLPPEVKANEALTSEASPTLDALTKLLRYWCTRSYEGYHEAVALWVLSTIAARRVYLPWQDGKWTPLYIMLVADSTTHAKTRAAGYGRRILEDCGLKYLLSPDEITPHTDPHSVVE